MSRLKRTFSAHCIRLQLRPPLCTWKTITCKLHPTSLLNFEPLMCRLPLPLFFLCVCARFVLLLFLRNDNPCSLSLSFFFLYLILFNPRVPVVFVLFTFLYAQRRNCMTSPPPFAIAMVVEGGGRVTVASIWLEFGNCVSNPPICESLIPPSATVSLFRSRSLRNTTENQLRVYTHFRLCCVEEEERRRTEGPSSLGYAFASLAHSKLMSASAAVPHLVDFKVTKWSLLSHFSHFQNKSWHSSSSFSSLYYSYFCMISAVSLNLVIASICHVRLPHDLGILRTDGSSLFYE